MPSFYYRKKEEQYDKEGRNKNGNTGLLQDMQRAAQDIFKQVKA